MRDLERWRETATIARAATTLAEPRLAVVVRLEGSGYRRPGAKLLLDGDEIVAGVVSGGCLEEDLRLHARDLVGGRVLSYDTAADVESALGIPLACDGRLDVLLLALGAAEVETLERAARTMERHEPLSLELGVDGSGRAVVQAGAELPEEPRLVETGDGWRFVDPLRPPPTLTIFGAGADTQPLAALAAGLGFRVEVVDHRAARGGVDGPVVRRWLRPIDGVDTLATGAGDLAVIKMHHGQHDRAWLEALLDTEIGYIGVVGPRRRTRRLLSEFGGDPRGRVHGPVGLDIGAEGPGQIAVAVIAEALAVRAGRSGGHLRDRAGAVHARTR